MDQQRARIAGGSESRRLPGGTRPSPQVVTPTALARPLLSKWHTRTETLTRSSSSTPTGKTTAGRIQTAGEAGAEQGPTGTADETQFYVQRLTKTQNWLQLPRPQRPHRPRRLSARRASSSRPAPCRTPSTSRTTAAPPPRTSPSPSSSTPNLDWSTFQLGSFGFGPINVTVPAGLTQYQTTVSYQNTDGTSLNVQVALNFNVQTGLLTVTFTSLDPLTGQAPTGVFDGFLPPDNSSGIGEGYVQYTVQPKAGLTTGTTINQQASVVFDTNAPINTATVTNTIDTGAADQQRQPAAGHGTAQLHRHLVRTGRRRLRHRLLQRLRLRRTAGRSRSGRSDTTQTSATFTGHRPHLRLLQRRHRQRRHRPADADGGPGDDQIVSPLSLTSIAAVSPNPRNSAVSSIDVTFSEPVNLTTFTDSALTLTDNGGANLITSAVTVALVSGSTYQINGLSGLTASNGNYTLTVNATGIQDTNGNAGTNSLSTSWLMDTTPPTSTISPLPARETSLVFPVSVTGSDGGSPAVGRGVLRHLRVDQRRSLDVLDERARVQPDGRLHRAEQHHLRVLQHRPRPCRQHRESRQPVIEASTYVPDLTPPVTTVDATTGTNPSTVNTTTGTFTLNITGSDPGGGLITYFEVYVSIDGGAYQEVGPYAIPAGAADSSGNYHSTVPYQGLTDGKSHSYSFYSIGLDSAGNLQSAPSSPNVTFANETFAVPTALAVTSFTVEHDSPSRSFVRYLDIGFNESDSQSGRRADGDRQFDRRPRRPTS